MSTSYTIPSLASALRIGCALRAECVCASRVESAQSPDDVGVVESPIGLVVFTKTATGHAGTLLCREEAPPQFVQDELLDSAFIAWQNGRGIPLAAMPAKPTGVVINFWQSVQERAAKMTRTLDVARP